MPRVMLRSAKKARRTLKRVRDARKNPVSDDGKFKLYLRTQASKEIPPDLLEWLHDAPSSILSSLARVYSKRHGPAVFQCICSDYLVMRLCHLKTERFNLGNTSEEEKENSYGAKKS